MSMEYFHLFCLHFLSSILLLSVYRSFTSLVKFIPSIILFDSVVDGIVFLISFSGNLFLMQKGTDFCILILCPATLVNSFISVFLISLVIYLFLAVLGLHCFLRRLSVVVASGCSSSSLWRKGSSVGSLLLWTTGSRAWTQQLWPSGLVAPRYVESSRTRDQTCVPCIGRQIFIHQATREVPIYLRSFVFLVESLEVSVNIIMPSTNGDNSTSSFPTWIPLFANRSDQRFRYRVGCERCERVLVLFLILEEKLSLFTIECVILAAAASLSRVRLCVTPQTAARQAPRPWGSPGKNTGVGCHCLLR